MRFCWYILGTSQMQQMLLLTCQGTKELLDMSASRVRGLPKPGQSPSVKTGELGQRCNHAHFQLSYTAAAADVQLLQVWLLRAASSAS